MKYKQIRITYKDYPSKLNRTLLVRSDTNLLVLGSVIATAFQTDFEHYYLFKTKDKNYVPDVFMEDAFDNDDWMQSYTLGDLPDKFTYEYDTGEGYEFKCEVQKEIEKDSKQLAFVTKVKGYGIFENNRYGLNAYLEEGNTSKAQKEFKETQENNFCVLPFDDVTEFDNYSLEEAKEEIEDMFVFNFNQWLKYQQEAGYEMKAKELPYEEYDDCDFGFVDESELKN